MLGPLASQCWGKTLQTSHWNPGKGAWFPCQVPAYHELELKWGICCSTQCSLKTHWSKEKSDSRAVCVFWDIFLRFTLWQNAKSQLFLEHLQWTWFCGQSWDAGIIRADLVPVLVMLRVQWGRDANDIITYHQLNPYRLVSALPC